MTTAAITHSVPGRLRVRVRGTQAEKTRALTKLQQRMPEHAQVSMDTRTGSALVTYDPRQTRASSIIEVLRDVDEIFADVAEPEGAPFEGRGASDAAQAVYRSFSQANLSALRATGGRIDLRMLFPVALGGLALGQLLRHRGGLGSAPWYVLGYYAFDSYIKLHAPTAATEQR